MDSLVSALTAYYDVLQTELQQHCISASVEIAVGGVDTDGGRFDLRAQLTTSEGSRRLERAAVKAHG